MIELISLSPEWLEQKRKKYSKDPGIMESMIRALYLLEQLQLTGLDFVFKGGTCLVLLLEQPKRFSVDIDIIVNPEITREKLEEYLSGIVETNAFIRMEVDERRSYKEGIPKAHYKFIYQSNVSTKSKAGEIIEKPEREILLDVLFAEHPYPTIIQKPIMTEWLSHSGGLTMVRMPDANSIAGDKLTAFAPNTTGVPYKADKEKEILKQVFDIGCLFHLLDDVSVLKRAYHETAKGEIQYRPERKIESVEQILRDTVETALLIAKRDHQDNNEDKEKMAEINKGIGQFRHFVFEGNFRIEEAQVASAKAAYLAAIILLNYDGELVEFDSKAPMQSYLVTHPEYNFLNKRLKFVAQGEALFYWHKTIALMYPEGD